MGLFILDVALGNFSLGTFTWEFPTVNFNLESSAWGPSLENVRLTVFIGEFSFLPFRLEHLVWELLRGTSASRSQIRGNWVLEAGGPAAGSWRNPGRLAPLT